MNTTKRRLHYLLECIVKDETTPKELHAVYKTVLESLRDAQLCVITNFSAKQILSLLKAHENIEVTDVPQMQMVLKKELVSTLNEALEGQKKAIFISLMRSNFPAKNHFLEDSIQDFENNLSPVELKMYTIIKMYIGALLEALDIFVCFDERQEASVEQLSFYALRVHEPLLQQIFFEEERGHVEEGLKQIAVVYIGLYYQHLYM